MKNGEKHKKLTVDPNYVRPKKAVGLLKVAHSMKQTVYIYGATGYGKTSLVAGFLARKKYHYITMAENMVEDLSMLTNKLEEQDTVVIDDLQEIVMAEDRENCLEILQRLIADSHVWVILISRCEIPAWLMPLYIRFLFTIIQESDLTFSIDDMQVYLSSWDIVLTERAEKYLYKMSKGFPLFVRIAALRLHNLGMSEMENEDRAKMELDAISLAKQDWWDYLDSSLYDQWDIELQEFLMDVSIVDCFDMQMAQIITKKNDTGELIALTKETGNYMTEKSVKGKTIYELRAPIRLSLNRRLQKKRSHSYIRNLYYNAASCYEYQGKVAEALEMYELCGDNEGISRLLVENARKHVGAGQYWKLRKYYLNVPKDMIMQNPELMAAVSMLHSIMLNDEESDRWYKALEAYAKQQTGTAKRAAQVKLVYLDVALPQRGIGSMIELVKKAGVLVANRRTILPEFSITNNQPSLMNGGKDFCEWSKKDKQLANSIGKLVELVTGKAGKGIVNLALAESMFEKGGDSYEVSVRASKGRVQAESCECFEEVFVAVGMLAQLEVQNNHLEDALDSVKSFRESIPETMSQLLQGVDTFRMRMLLYSGLDADVTEWLKQAPDEDKEFCTLDRFHYMIKVRVYLALGKKERAIKLLHEIIYFAEKRERIFIRIEAGVLLAIVQYRMKDDKWKQTLQEAISLAEEYHFVRVFSREGAALWELLRGESFEWKDADFRDQVRKECEYMASLYPMYLKEKPDGTITLSAAQVKVLRMQESGMSVEQIADALGLSKAGVKYYNQQTYKMLGVNSKSQAIFEARNRGLI